MKRSVAEQPTIIPPEITLSTDNFTFHAIGSVKGRQGEII